MPEVKKWNSRNEYSYKSTLYLLITWKSFIQRGNINLERGWWSSLLGDFLWYRTKNFSANGGLLLRSQNLLNIKNLCNLSVDDHGASMNNHWCVGQEFGRIPRWEKSSGKFINRNTFYWQKYFSNRRTFVTFLWSFFPTVKI